MDNFVAPEELSHEEFLRSMRSLPSIRQVPMTDRSIADITEAVERCPIYNRGRARKYAYRLALLQTPVREIVLEVREVYGRIDDAL